MGGGPFFPPGDAVSFEGPVKPHAGQCLHHCHLDCEHLCCTATCCLPEAFPGGNWVRGTWDERNAVILAAQDPGSHKE